MATAADNRVSMQGDVLFFITFALGMAGFWLSGHAGVLVRQFGGATLSNILSLGATVGVYAAGMAILAYVVTRRLKATLIATLVAAVLGLVTAQIIVRLAAGHITNTQQLGLLTFVLYLCYGFIYVGALAAGRKLAPPRPD